MSIPPTPYSPTLFVRLISRPYTIAAVATPAEKSVKNSTGRITTGIMDDEYTITSSHQDTEETWCQRGLEHTHARLAVLDALEGEEGVERRAWSSD